MTTVMQRQRSRRKLAALTFLSNISLDGTHRDTKLSRYKLGSALTMCLIEQENIQKRISNEKEVVATKNKTNEEDDSLEIVVPAIGQTFQSANPILRVPSQTSFREKASTMSEITDRPMVTKKRAHHHSSCSDRVPYNFSSSESLGGNFIGIGGRTRKSSSTHSDSSMVPSREINLYRKALGSRIKEDRLVLLSSNKMPCHIFSTIPYRKIGEHIREGSKRRHTSGTRPLSTISDSTDPSHIIGMVCIEENLEVSYCDLLVPSKNFFVRPKTQHTEHHTELADISDRLGTFHTGVTRCLSYEPSQHRASVQLSHAFNAAHPYEEDTPQPTTTSVTRSYVPNVLDDPELRAGKHRKLLRFPSYMTSVIDYTKPSELKKELNDKFREKFPHIKLTLSKLRSLKRDMAKIASQVECEIDVLLTVANSYVYFEQLILKRIVNKSNRKLVAAACLMLSAKMNDVKGEQLTDLIECTESIFRLSRRELLLWEFASLVALEFSLHIPSWMVSPHYQRLQSEIRSC